MGNSSSVDGKSLEDVSIDSALDLLSRQPVCLVNDEIQRFFKFHTEDEMLKISKRIYERAVETSNNLCYVELVQNMPNEIGIGNFSRLVTFNEVFTKHASSQFMYTPQWNLNMASFLGHLFANDMLPASMVIHCIKLMQDQRLVQDKMLLTIKHRIMNITPEQFNRNHDLGELKKMMIERGFITKSVPHPSTTMLRELTTPPTTTPPTTTPPTTTTFSTTAPLTRLSPMTTLTPIIEASVTSSRPQIQNAIQPIFDFAQASHTSSRPPSAMQVIGSADFSSSMTKAFKVFINNIHKPHNVGFKFNLKQLKTCDGTTRRTCAKLMLDTAITNPDNCIQYVNLMREIQHSVSSLKSDKTFLIHLGELFELEIDKVFGQPNKQWMRITNIGIFLSRLYMQDYMKNALMTKWLDNVHAAIDNKESEATRTLLISLRIMINKMMLRDIKSYVVYTQLVERLVADRRLPRSCMPWLKDILGNNFKQYETATSANSSALVQSPTIAQSSTNAQSSTSSQSTTGAIKKTTVGQPITQLAASAIFYESLRNLLNGKSSSFDCTRLDTCPEQTVAGCALVLIEHAAGQPENAKLYAAVTANAIISQLKSQTRKKLVVKSLAYYFAEEIKKCFKTGFPEKCLWGRINNVGAFLCELYNFEVVEGGLMSDWIKSINAFLLHEPAIEAMLIVMKAVGWKMKERDPLYFNSYMDIEFMRSLIPNKYTEMYYRVMELKTGNIDSEILQSKEVNAAQPSTVNFKEPQPSTSRASSSDQPYEFLTKLKDKSTKELEVFTKILKFESKADMKAFAEVFFNIASKSQDMSVYAKLAKIISLQMPTEEKEEELKESIVSETLGSYYALMAQPGTMEAQQKTVKFITDLFNVGFIKSLSHLLINKIETIDRDYVWIIDSIRILLQAISMTVVKNGDGGSYEDCHKLLQTKKNYFTYAVYYLKYLEAIEILEDMISFGNASQAKSIEVQVQAVIDVIKDENVNETAEKIKAINLSFKDLQSATGIVLSKAVSDSDASSACCQLVREIQDLSADSPDESKISLKEVLVESCQEMVLNNFKGELRPYQLKEATNLLEFVGDLFLNDVFNINFIILCIELLIDDDSNNAADCLSFLLKKTGSKVDSVNETKLDEYFTRFDTFTQDDYSYRSNTFEDLRKLRRNNWMPACVDPGIQINESSPDLKTILNQISGRNMQEALRCSKDFIDQSDDNQKKLIDVLWCCIISQSCQTKFLAKLCRNLSVEYQHFNDSLIEFLQCRVITLASVPKQRYSEASQMKLANIMMFISRIYILDVVTEDKLEMLLKPVKLLPFNSVSAIVSIIEPKISKSENIRLKALIINLDELSHEGSLMFLREVKGEIEEINEILHDQKCYI